MKINIASILLIAATQFATAQNPKPAAPKADIRYDGIYECKDWKLVDGNIDMPVPAYYKFFPEGVLLFCQYLDIKDRDSTTSPQEIYSAVLSEEHLNKIKENVEEDPTNVFKVYGKFKVTAYRYQKETGGICYDILSERPNCLGKPNIKVVSGDLIKSLSQSQDPADDRYFKFVSGN